LNRAKNQDQTTKGLPVILATKTKVAPGESHASQEKKKGGWGDKFKKTGKRAGWRDFGGDSCVATPRGTNPFLGKKEPPLVFLEAKGTTESLSEPQRGRVPKSRSFWWGGDRSQKKKKKEDLPSEQKRVPQPPWSDN